MFLQVEMVDKMILVILNGPAGENQHKGPETRLWKDKKNEKATSELLDLLSGLGTTDWNADKGWC